MSNPRDQEELKQFETSLKSLSPATFNLPREQILFQAGQAQGRKRQRHWIILAGSLGVFAGVLLGYPIFHDSSRPAERVVVVTVEKQVPAPSPRENRQPPKESISNPDTSPGALRPGIDLVQSWEEPAPMPGTYLHLRGQVLRWGPDVLPNSEPTQGAVSDPVSLLMVHQKTKTGFFHFLFSQ